MAQNNQGVSEDTRLIVTVLLLIFVYPVGLIVMWLWTHWAKWVKVVISLPVILFFGFLILGGGAVFITSFMKSFFGIGQ